MKAIFLTLIMAISCTACAIIPEQVDVAYSPDPTVTRTRVLPSADIQLQVTDTRRAESPAWIADKKNGYGMRMASIAAQRPVVDLVKDALTQELTGMGYRVGTSGATVAMEVSRLESVYQTRFFSIGAIGSADISVQIRRTDGGIAYARNFSVTNDDEAGLAGIPAQARRSVESAMSKIVGQIIADPAFLKALSPDARLS